MSGSLPQHPKGVAGMGPPQEDNKDGGGGTLCVSYLLHSGGPGSSDIQVRKMCALSGDVKEAGGSPRVFSLEDHREESVAALVWDMEEVGGSKCSQGKRDADFRGVY